MASCGFYGVLALEVAKAGRAATDRSSYAAYYNEVRTHLALGKDAPLSRAVQRTGVIASGFDFRKAQDRQPYPGKEFLEGDPHQPQALRRLERVCTARATAVMS
jgi:hypothetical protein